MTTAYTSLLGLALPVTGENQGTWGDLVNQSITLLLDSAIAGTTTISTDGDVTLTTTTGASNQAREAIILCSGARTAQRTITAPAQSKIYTIINNTTGGYAVKLVGTGPTTGITVVAGESALVAWNGSDFIKISNTGGTASFTNVTVSGTTTLSGLTASTALALDASKNVVSVTNTGTGNNVLSASPTLTGTVAGASLQLSSLTSGRVTYAGASGLLQDNANLTFDGTTLTAAGLATGGSVTLSGGTANGVLYLNGSKVATSGSALTYNGSVLTLAPNQVAFGSTTSLALGSGSYFLAASTAGFLVNNSADTLNFFKIDTSGNAIFYPSGTEGMRLTSTGLGIGTSSPGAKLEVNGNVIVGSEVYRSSDSSFMRLAGGNPASTGATVLMFGSTHATAPGRLSLTATGTGWIEFYTGGSERMRLDSSGNLGVGTSSPSRKFEVQGAPLGVGGSGTGVLASFVNNSTSYNASPTAAISLWNKINSGGTAFPSAVVQAGKENATDGNYAGYLSLQTTDAAGTSNEWVRLDSSGNLGIGTSSPITRLDINKSSQTPGTTTPSGALVVKNTAAGAGCIEIGSGSPTLGYIQVRNTDNTTMYDMVLQPSGGNLGLGVTPSAWGTGYRAFDVRTSGIYDVLGSETGVAFNAYYDTSWKYKGSGGTATALRYVQTNGQHQWFTAPSGTAGNAISFTQAMTLDASGNLLLGTTSTGADGLGVSNLLNLTFPEGSGTSYVNLFRQTSSAATILANGYKRSATSNGFASSVGTSWAKSAISLNSGVITFYTDTAATVANGTDVTPTPRATIDSSGNLLVGTQSAFAADNKLLVANSTVSTPAASFWNATTTGDPFFLGFSTESPTATTRGSVTYNRAGGLTAYNTTSDYRAKDIIGPVQDPGATIDALKIYEGKMKGATQSRPMLIAHEAQAVTPYAVTGEKDAVNEDGTPKYQQMDVSSLVPLLLAEIKSLRARVAQLEAKG